MALFPKLKQGVHKEPREIWGSWRDFLACTTHTAQPTRVAQAKPRKPSLFSPRVFSSAAGAAVLMRLSLPLAKIRRDTLRRPPAWPPNCSMRGKCWWRGGKENELAFMLGAVKLGPFKFGKDKNEVKTYKFFVNDGKVRRRENRGETHAVSLREIVTFNGRLVLCNSSQRVEKWCCIVDEGIYAVYKAGVSPLISTGVTCVRADLQTQSIPRRSY